jgi:hypothetical protein
MFIATRRRRPAIDDTTDMPPFRGRALPSSSGARSLAYSKLGG